MLNVKHWEGGAVKLWNKAKDKNIWHDLTWLDLNNKNNINYTVITLDSLVSLDTSLSESYAACCKSLSEKMPFQSAADRLLLFT